MVAVTDSNDLYCLKCEFCHKIKCCNGWTCLLTQETGYPAYADAFDRLDNCPIQKDTIQVMPINKQVQEELICLRKQK